MERSRESRALPRGIGKACALALAEAGADLALGARNLARLEAAAGEIQEMGRKGVVIPLDVSQFDAVTEGVARALQALGKLDILVNNAGMTKDNLVMRMNPEDWSEVLRTNLDGAYFCIRAVLPGMVRQRYGRIINVASVVAQTGNAGQANYIASKAGLTGLSKAVAVETAISATGATLLYLPPFSPDLNPIERFFSKLKALLRKAAKRDIDTLRKEIGELLNTVSPSECTNYFAFNGYVST